MKNANEVLQEKEAELARVRHEIESLKIVAGLLADHDPNVEDFNPATDQPGQEPLTNTEALSNAEEEIDVPVEATGTHGLFSSFSEQHLKRWNVLKRHS